MNEKPWISYAIWDNEDLNNIEVVKDFIKRKKLNRKAVFVGLNPSADIKPLQNFHKTHLGGKDSRIRDALNDSCLRGILMTDLFSVVAIDEKRLKRILKEKPLVLRDNIERFKKEIDFHAPNGHIILCGKNVQDYFDKYIDSEFKKKMGSRIHKIHHYQATKKGMTREYWIDKMKEIASKICSKNSEPSQE